MKMCDLDGNGYIDCNEFMVSSTNRPNFLNRERMIQMFNYLDKVIFILIIILNY